MLGEDLREFLTELESRFPEWQLPEEKKSLIKRLELEYEGKHFRMNDFLSLLKSGQEQLNRQAPVMEGQLEFAYRQRLSELENTLISKNAVIDDCELEIARLHSQISNLQQQRAGETHEMQHFYRKDQLNYNGKDEMINGKGVEMTIQKLKALVQSLLRATQLLSRDRSELYQQLFLVLQGGRITNKTIARKLGVEGELVQVYNDVLDLGTLENRSVTQQHRQRPGSLQDKKPTEIYFHFRPIFFVSYSLFLWICGVLLAFLVHDYVAYSDLYLFRSTPTF